MNGIITGFSYQPSTGEWFADYKTKNKWVFKPLYKNKLGYFIKSGKNVMFLTDEQAKILNNQRKSV
jgi:hypothetical protein